LDDGARRWISEAVGRMLVYLQVESERDVTAVMLDDAWIRRRAEWRNTGGGDQPIKDAINEIGLTFGQILVDRLGMEWVIATDLQGTEFAVRSESGWVTYPRDFVKKRYANDESGFMTAMFSHYAAELGDG
jgi:hypothetical protein